MSDLIERDKAIEAIRKLPNAGTRWIVSAESVFKVLMQLPSADNEVIGELKTAIENEEICKSCPTVERITGENFLGAMALGFSYGMEADRPQGEWIEDPINKNIMHCSNCKVSYTKDFLRGMSLYHEPKDTPDFCPRCGADMRGAENGTDKDKSNQ